MKFLKFPTLFLLLFLFACEGDNINNNNPFLPNLRFSFDVNLNLPSNASLNFVENGVYIPAAGVRGLFVFNTGSGFTAFDAACPNQPLENCSTMTLSVPNAVCPCDGTTYSLFTGLSNSGLPYPLKPYRVEVLGNVVRVFN
jgi:nitrite reductase/ring-hydroxylating ferredoxin subunit